MAESAARVEMIRRLREAAAADPRIVGLLDYGSGSRLEADEWSDVDVEVFIRDQDLPAFARDWVTWAGQFGQLLLAYIGRYGHPWTVYDAAPLPLRVDFSLHRASEIPSIRGWPSAPVSLAAMLLYDGSDGALTAVVRELVGRSLEPTDLAATFTQECGDLWYFLLLVHSKLNRGELWVARQVFHLTVLEHLLHLLRLEAGAVERWQGAHAAQGVEQDLTPARLVALDPCIPGAGAEGMRAALAHTAVLGRDVCASVATRHGWPWPAELAERCLALFAQPQR